MVQVSSQQISSTAQTAQAALNKMKNGEVPTKSEFLDMVKHAAIEGQNSPFTRQFMLLAQEMDNDPDAAIEKQFDDLKLEIAGMSKSELQDFGEMVRAYLHLNPEYQQQQAEWERIKASAPNVGWV